MKSYLIGLKIGNRMHAFTSVYGDTPSRPFSICSNLWNYKTPWHAARLLEKMAQAMESNGVTVQRVYGTVADMPKKGNVDNVFETLLDWGICHV